MKNFFLKAKQPTDNSAGHHEVYNPLVQEFLNSVIKLDVNGNLISFNQAFAAQYGYREKDFKKPFFDVFLKNEILQSKNYLEKAILGKMQQFDAIGLKKNGKSVDIHVTLIPIETKTDMMVYVVVKDISEYKAQEKELLLSQKRQQTFNELENICYFYYDAINDRHYFSKQFPALFGLKVDNSFAPTLQQLLQHVYPEDRITVKNTIEDALHNKTGYELEYRIPNKDKTIRYVYEKTEILLDQNGHLDGLNGFIQDITHCKISEQVLEKEKQLTYIYDNPDVGIWTMNGIFGQTVQMSKGFEHISGYTAEDFNNGTHWSSIIHPQDLEKYRKHHRGLESGNIVRHQYRIIHKNGDVKWVQDYAVPVLDAQGKLLQINGITSDVTMQKGLEEQIKYLSEHDPLTQLPNRQIFYEKVQELTAKYAHSNNKFAIMLLNIDRFKYVNDTLGYEIGDELLLRIAERLSKLLTSQDVLARQDGAQFSILIESLNSVESVKISAQRIINCLEEPFYIKDYQLYVTVCIGIGLFPDNGTDSLELFRNADHALFQSKKSGENKYHIITHSSNIQSYKSFSIGRDLKKALKDNEMVMYYQPRVDAETHKIISAEALIRWNHPEWGHISPNEFLTIAEENGLIIDIDNWVLQEVCQQIKSWKQAGLQMVPVSVNISAAHLSIQDWPITVAKIIENAGIQPQDIELEITENSLLNNERMIKTTIELFRKLGIKIALDDFGKGYSSLLYLTQYSFDIIKIDKSFIQNMHHSEQDLFIAKSIIYLAKGLHLRVVAEGVETIEQLEILQKEDCQEIQGYLFSRPVPVDEFALLLQKKVLSPIDPKQLAERSNRNYYRLLFPYPLASSMRLTSIAGRNMHLGKSTVLIDDISIDGLRCVSTLKLPVRGDVVFQFETEILNKPLQLLGRIVWKEELNDDLVEYGIQFILSNDEQTSLGKLLNTFLELLKKSKNLPPYNIVKEDKYQYLMRVNS